MKQKLVMGLLFSVCLTNFIIGDAQPKTAAEPMKLGKMQADEELVRKFEALDAQLKELQGVCNGILAFVSDKNILEPKPDYLVGYTALKNNATTWSIVTKSLSKVLFEIINIMPRSTAGKMDAKNQGRIKNARELIDRLSERFFARGYADLTRPGRDKIVQEIAGQSATLKPIRSLIPGMSDKRATVVAKKTLQNVFEMLRLMYLAAKGAQIPFYTLKQIMPPYQDRQYAYYKYFNEWREYGKSGR
ncbi:MAG: hypothetical protein M1549_04030 [Candidatus Dependentiae bacterium]|nr:hypothetical protein [Candidatus Dependentiae bacterium]